MKFIEMQYNPNSTSNNKHFHGYEMLRGKFHSIIDDPAIGVKEIRRIKKVIS